MSVHPDLLTHVDPNNKNWIAGKFNRIFDIVNTNRRKKETKEYNKETREIQKARKKKLRGQEMDEKVLNKDDLITNIQCSLEHALYHFIDADRQMQFKDSKIIIRELGHVIDLLLKAKLLMHAPEKEVWANKNQYPSQKAYFINFSECLKRLESYQVNFSVEFKERIENAMYLRNDLEHWKKSITSTEAGQKISEMLSIIYIFTKIHLKEKKLSDFLEEEWREAFDKYGWKEYDRFIQELEANMPHTTTMCGKCHYNTFDYEEYECYFCGNTDIEYEENEEGN